MSLTSSPAATAAPKPRPRVLAGSPPTRVAIPTRPVLGARLPAVAVAAVLWVPRILEGQAGGLLLRTAALCAWGRGAGFSWALVGPVGRSIRPVGGAQDPARRPARPSLTADPALPGGQVWQQWPGSWRGCPQVRAGHSGLMFLQLTLPGPLARRPHGGLLTEKTESLSECKAPIPGPQEGVSETKAVGSHGGRHRHLQAVGDPLWALGSLSESWGYEQPLPRSAVLGAKT